MHAVWARLNNTFFLALVALGICAAVAAVSDYTSFVVPPDGKSLISMVTEVALKELYVSYEHSLSLVDFVVACFVQ